MTFLSVLSFVFLVLTAVKSSPVVQIRDSPITIPIAARINATGGALALLKADRARILTLLSHNVHNAKRLEARKKVPVAVTDVAVSYTSEVGIGSPPTSYTLKVDTGSSNTWIGAHKAYKVTSTSHKTSNKVSVSYGKGNFSGDEYTDTVTLGSASIKAQSIGVALTSSDFRTGIDGVLGIGPPALTVGTLSPASSESIPTVTDNLKSQHLISSASVAVSFEPTTNLTEHNGQLDFGGVDHSKFTGSISYVDMTMTGPASIFWGMTQSITYGHSTPLLPSHQPISGIVDTDTTLLYLPSDAFAKYKAAAGATFDSATGLLKISYKNYNKLQSLFFTIGGVTFEFTANAQIWPRSLNFLIRGRKDDIYLVVADSGVTSRRTFEIQFINGFVWLQRFYSVFDTDKKRMGFATTPFTHAVTN